LLQLNQIAITQVKTLLNAKGIEKFEVMGGWAFYFSKVG
jgi:hypothetical protein